MVSRSPAPVQTGVAAIGARWLDAERAHTLTEKMMIMAHKLGMLQSVAPRKTLQPRQVMGMTFPNVIGLAAGMDKSASAVDAWGALGLGAVWRWAH